MNTPDPAKKERIAQKRQALIKEMYDIFVRSYEMDRAYRMPQQRAFDKAFQTLNIQVNVLIKKTPQETSFIIGCREEVKELLIKRVAELEGHGPKNIKTS